MRGIDGFVSGSILTTSFVKLRRLVVGFEHLRDGAPTSAAEDRALRRVTRQLGPVALNVLCRELGSARPDRARWAHTLLADLASDPRVGDRLVARLRATLAQPPPPPGDETRLRMLTLLSELGDDGAAGAGSGGAARASAAHGLAICLGSQAGIARAADHLLAELPIEEMLALFEDLIEVDAASAVLLLDELLLHDALDGPCRQELRQLRASAHQVGGAGGRAGTRARPGRPRTLLAPHADGRRILLVCGRQPGGPSSRQRVLCLLIGADGLLRDGFYAEDMTPGDVKRQFEAPLGEQGFGFGPAGLDATRGFLVQASRRAVQAGLALPRAFYLGRDLLGLRQEHLDGSAGVAVGADRAALLDRAIELLGAGEPAEARALAERYVAEAPDHAEGHAQLGLCRLGLGDPAAALQHLRRASWLEPDEPLHHWNLAAAAHAAGRRGTCYLALRAFCAAADTGAGAADRRDLAARFIGEYERLAQLEHPDTPPDVLAARDELHRPVQRGRRRSS